MALCAKFAMLALLCACLLEYEVKAVEVKHVRSGRSATWDEHIRKPRDTSEACSSEWTDNRNDCNPNDYMLYDALGRRQSGRLATAEYQGTCGNCWAFAATHTFSDFRSLLAGNTMPLLSADYVTRCLRSGGAGNGCCGYKHGEAMQQFVETGTVSRECLPSNLSDYIPKELSNEPESVKAFKDRNPLPECPATCNSGEAYVTAANKLAQFDFNCDGISNSEIKRLLYQSGPVTASMSVDDGFSSRYKCGVYCVSDPVTTGRHAVEIVDYGVSPAGTPFWVVKNSYGATWGENGYFRIRQGDLNIGDPNFPVSAPLRPGVQPAHGAVSDADLRNELATCAPREMTNANDSVLFRSAAEYGLNELRNLSKFQCPNGSNDSLASAVELVTVCNGTVQVVAGSIISVNVNSNVEGCGENYTEASVSLEVIANLDGSFTLTEYSDIMFNVRCSEFSGGRLLIGNLFLVWLLIAVALIQLA